MDPGGPAGPPSPQSGDVVIRESLPGGTEPIFGVGCHPGRRMLTTSRAGLAHELALRFARQHHV